LSATEPLRGDAPARLARVSTRVDFPEDGCPTKQTFRMDWDPLVISWIYLFLGGHEPIGLVESGVECFSSALGSPRVVRRGEQDTTLGGRVGL